MKCICCFVGVDYHVFMACCHKALSVKDIQIGLAAVVLFV